MSKLLSSLTQSESHRAAQPFSHESTGGMTGRAVTASGSNRRVVALCFAVPVIGVLVYAAIQAQRGEEALAQPENHIVVAEASTPALAVNRVQPSQLTSPSVDYYPTGIERLAYPDLYTEALPRVQSSSDRYVQPDSMPEPLPVTRQDLVPIDTDTLSVPELKTIPSEEGNWDLEALDYSELSPELASHLRSAIAATEDDEPLPQLLQEEREGDAPNEQESTPEPIAIGSLPVSVQNRIPTLNFQTHIYSSAANSRWVKVNDKEAFEGDEIAPGVVLRHIKPRTVVFDFDSYLVSMPALSEW